MSTQPEALRLADCLEELDAQFSFSGVCAEAAIELRNLYELSESESRWASEYLQRAVKAESRVHELESVLQQIQDWEAIAASQAFTISVLKITLLQAIEAMEIEEGALKYLKQPKAEHLNNAISTARKVLGDNT